MDKKSEQRIYSYGKTLRRIETPRMSREKKSMHRTLGPRGGISEQS